MAGKISDIELLVGNQLLKPTVKETVSEDVAHRELYSIALCEIFMAWTEGY